jgi:hypothetical protein
MGFERHFVGGDVVDSAVISKRRHVERVRARAVPVREPVPGGGRYDYADAFEVGLPEPDGRTAEEWARSGLERAPAIVRRTVVGVHRRILGFPLDPTPSATTVLGWRIRSSEPDAIVLEAASQLLRGVLVGRRPEPSRMELTTFLFYRRRRLARLIWAAVGPLHRAVAPLLLTRAAKDVPASWSRSSADTAPARLHQ